MNARPRKRPRTTDVARSSDAHEDDVAAAMRHHRRGVMLDIHRCVIVKKDAIVVGLDRCGLPNYFPETVSVTESRAECERVSKFGELCDKWKTLAGVWIPAHALQPNCIYLGDMRDEQRCCANRAMVRLLTRLSDTLFNRNSADETSRLAVILWRSDADSGDDGSFHEHCAGVSVLLQARMSADGSSPVTEHDVREAFQVLDIELRRETPRSVARGKRKDSAARTRVLDATAAQYYDCASDVVTEYLSHLNDPLMVARLWQMGVSVCLSHDVEHKMRERAGVGGDARVWQHYAFCKDGYAERRVWQIVLPHVARPVADFVRYACGCEHLRTDDLATVPLSDNDTSMTSNIITYERRLQTLYERLRAHGAPDALRRFMFRLYASVCRGADENVSRVAECVHGCRRERRIDELSDAATSAYAMTRSHDRRALQPYDYYRSVFMRNLCHQTAARISIVPLAQFYIENATCAYNCKADDMVNVVAMGKSGYGKDRLLSTLERVFVRGTVEKISRATRHADSTECRGRDDGLVIYNPEKRMADFCRTRGRSSGDTITKDRQSSGRVVTRRFRYDARGRRVAENVVNERHVLEYYAMNPSSLSRVEEGTYQRSLWICCPPPTDSTQCDILNAVYANSAATGSTATTTNTGYDALVHTQRFLQLCAFEVHKMESVGAMAPVVTDAANVALLYVVHFLTDRRSTFGCTASVYRRYKQAIALAKEHAIRRIVVSAFFDRRSAYFGVRATPARLAALRYYVSVRDLALAFGQIGEYMGIFQEGEVQVVMALRYLWITNSCRHAMFGNDVGSLNAHDVACDTMPSPRYVRFKGKLDDIARECVQVLLHVCPKERGAPTPISREMALDALHRITCSNDNTGMPTMVKMEDDCIVFTEHWKRMFGDTTSQSRSKMIADARKHSRDFNAADSLYACLRIDDEQRAACSDVRVHQPRPAIIRRGNRAIDVHVWYLTRLFDPRRQCWPWTERKPDAWSPQINEHSLLRSALEALRSHRFQNDPPRIVYKIEYTGAKATGRSTKVSASYNIDYVTKKHAVASGKLRVPAPADTSSPGASESAVGSSSPPRPEDVGLCASIDDIAMYATQVGWERAVNAAADEARWRNEVVEQGKLQQVFEAQMNFRTNASYPI